MIRPMLIVFLSFTAIAKPVPAHAIFLTKACEILLLPVTKPAQWIWNKKATSAQKLRVEVAGYPWRHDYLALLGRLEHLSAEELAELRTLSESDARLHWRLARQYPSLVGPLWRRHEMSKPLRRLKFAVFFTLIGAATAQYAFSLDTYGPGEARPPLGPDEIELVTSGIHAWARVNGHNYDYMGENLRKDSGKLVGDFELSGSLRIRIKATPKAIARLHQDLERSLGRTGPMGFPPLWNHNCISNILRKLDQHLATSVPMGLDRSPAMTLAWFRLRKALGDPTVGEIYFDRRIPDFGHEMEIRHLMETAFSSFFFANALVTSLTDPGPDEFARAERQTLLAELESKPPP